jgi:hypothetical protein
VINRENEENINMIRTVGDISRVSAHLYGDKTALIIEDKQFRFRQIGAMTGLSRPSRCGSPTISLKNDPIPRESQRQAKFMARGGG